MVPTSTIVTIFITLFVTLVLPFIVYIIYGVKNKGKGVWTAWLLGAAGFFVFQVIIRMPILNVLSIIPGFTSFATNHYVIYCLVLALTAALFEVAGRYIVAKILAKKLTYTRSFAAGLGHGSIEAVFIVGMTYINNLAYSMMINTGGFDGVIEQVAALGVDATPYMAIKDSLINTPAGTFLLAGYERILSVILHIALSMLVCYFVSRRQDFKGIVICVLIHWAVDFVSPMISGLATEYMGNVISIGMSYVLVYIFLTAVAVGSVVVIRKLKKAWEVQITSE